MPLPEAYRSLLRPSSPDDAKAFANGCNWFYANAQLSRRLFYPLTKIFLTLNFQRTKVYALFCASYSVVPVLLRQGYGGHPSPLSRMAAPSKARQERRMVGPDGLEPSTPRLSSACSNQLSYEPRKETVSVNRDKPCLVEPDGFEPTTSCLQSRRSAN